MVRLRHGETGLLETAASKGITTVEFATSINPLGLADEIFEARSLVTVGSVFEDARIKDCELFQREGLASFVGLPMVASGEFLGSLIFLTREEHHFGEEMGFLSL
jgi:GAF domain-containing protein